MENKPNVVAATIQQNTPTHQSFRFTGRHLGIWLLLAAAITALAMAHVGTTPQDAPRYIRALITGIVAATSFLGTGMMIIAKRHDQSFQIQPGHWFLFVGGVIYLWFLLGFCFPPEHRLLFSLLRRISLISAGIVILIASIKSCETLPWTCVLGLFSVALLSAGLGPMISFFALLFLACFGLIWIALPVAIYLDRRERISRNNLHWLGTGIFVVIILDLSSFALLPI